MRRARRNRIDRHGGEIERLALQGRIYLVHNVVFRNKSGADEGGDEDEDEGGGGGLRMRGRSGELRFRDPITLATSRDGYAFDTAHAPEPFNYTPMAVNPISSGSPHVRPMGGAYVW